MPGGGVNNSDNLWKIRLSLLRKFLDKEDKIIMCKKTVKRILATVLAFTMMWGMCLSVSAATYGNATTCEEGHGELTASTEN